MVGLGTHSTIERVEIGNSQPKAARASALPDGLLPDGYEGNVDTGGEFTKPAFLRPRHPR